MDCKADVDLGIVHHGNRLNTEICLPTCLHLAMPRAPTDGRTARPAALFGRQRRHHGRAFISPRRHAQLGGDPRAQMLGSQQFHRRGMSEQQVA